MVFATHQRSDQAESVMLAGLVREQVVARAREQVACGVDVEIEFIPEPRDDVIPDRRPGARRGRVAKGDSERRRRAAERVLDRLGIEQMVFELSSTGRPRGSPRSSRSSGTSLCSRYLSVRRLTDASN